MPAIKKTTLYVSMTILVVACIEKYRLEDHVEYIPKLVVDGILTNEADTQNIFLSVTSSTEQPEFIPFSGCRVEVSDNRGNIFSFTESAYETGNYIAIIEEEYFREGAGFSLQITTPENRRYLSTMEDFNPSPPIDSVYYEIASLPTADPETYIDGVQFYLDFIASDNYGKNYRYVLEETYEYHSTWPMRAYLDETGFHYPPTDYSKFTCYSTEELSHIFLLSTSNLEENSYIKYPLNFVDDHTQRLLYNYSLLVKQFSLSESAYIFWETLKENNQEVEGIYSKQPSLIKGNISNENDAEEIVLGYFGVSSIAEYRIVLGPVKELSFFHVPYCDPIIPEVGYPHVPRPLYLVLVDGEIWAYNSIECFDCTLLGGTVDKPPFFE